MDALNNWAYRDLSYMFKDKNFVMSLLETDEKNLAKQITIQKDGSVVLGKTPYRWINKLFNGEKILSPEVVCLRLIKIVTGFGGGKNQEAYRDLCKRFTDYYEDGNINLAITAIFVAYRFVMAPDIKTLSNEERTKTVERKIDSPPIDTILLNGIMIKDGNGNPILLDTSSKKQIIFRRP